MDTKKRNLLPLLLATSFFLLALFIYIKIAHNNFYTDEQAHAYTIISFFTGHFTLPEILTTLPGYHYLAYIWTKIASFFVADPTGYPSLRLFSIVLAATSAYVFFKCAQKIDKSTAVLKTAGYAVLPLAFPYFFLAYTETASSLFILLALYFYLSKRPIISSLFGAYAVFIRQPNIIWIGFLFALLWLDHKKIKTFIQSSTGYLLTALAFAAFVFINGGVALGDSANHPAFSFHLGNIYFALTLFFIVFLPLIAASATDIVKYCKKHIIPSFSIGVGTLTLSAYFYTTFIPDHQYNNIEQYGWFLRNQMLDGIVTNPVLKALVAISFIITILFLATQKLEHKKYTFLYLFSILALIPFWLIENRYYIIAFMLFILFRKPAEKVSEIVQIGWMTIISGILMWKIIALNGQWFL